MALQLSDYCCCYAANLGLKTPPLDLIALFNFSVLFQTYLRIDDLITRVVKQVECKDMHSKHLRFKSLKPHLQH